MAQMGRPRIEINKEEFEKLCALLCSEEEIASWFDVSVDTLCRWCKREYGVTFAEIYKTKSEKGRIALRRYQFNLFAPQCHIPSAVCPAFYIADIITAEYRP